MLILNGQGREKGTTEGREGGKEEVREGGSEGRREGGSLVPYFFRHERKHQVGSWSPLEESACHFCTAGWHAEN